MSEAVAASLGVFRHHLPPGLLSIVVLSLVSAAAYGLAAVLQHHEATKKEETAGGNLIAQLLREPVWLAGTLLDGVGYLFQFLALRRGSLALVEPLLVLSLVFALPVAARLEHRRVSWSDVGAAVVTVGGLTIFQEVARPGIGHPHASATAWIVLSAVIAVGCLTMALLARRGSARQAALLYAAGSGTAFGYVAAVTERTGHSLDHGAIHVLTTWAPYVLVLAAVVALVLTQQAFNAGLLRLSLPTLTVAQPIVALAIGIGFFGEKVRSQAPAVVAEVAGFVVMTIGVYALTKSPVLTAAHKPET
ncbi:MAG TPA: DMT family transporter [Acidimicrobiales bacterium]|nr:DMT family transporter [Acidimicrobiales bacterium]